MFRALIAEDESLIRNGLAASLNWKDLNLELAGTAKNGEEALNQIEENNIDLLLTDIHMPKKNGLELIAEARQINPDLHIIIISGYDNFSYAQKALQLGVDDYVLKPIDMDQLEKIMAETVQKMEEEQSKSFESEQKEFERKENSKLLKNLFFRDLVYNNISPEELTSKLNYSRLQDDFGYLLPVNIYIDLFNPISPGKLTLLLENLFEPVTSSRKMICQSSMILHNDISLCNILFIYESEETLLDTESLKNQLADTLNAADEISLNGIGIGYATERLNDLPLSFQKSRYESYYNLLSGREVQKRFDQNKELNESVLNMRKISEDIYHAFDRGSVLDFKEILLEIEKVLHRNISGNEDDIESNQGDSTGILKWLYVTIITAGENKGYPVHTVISDISQLTRILKLKPADEILRDITWLGEKIIMSTQSNPETNSRTAMQLAKDYIEMNFSNPLISLDEIAEKFDLSTAYFSQVFKKTHGKSYIEYLTELRIAKAVDIMKTDPHIKILNVARLVGYNNISHFNYIFKKNTGKTPREIQKEYRD